MSITKVIPTKVVPQHTVVDYHDLADAVEALLTEREGREVDIRDYEEMFKGARRGDAVRYLDFWHWWIDNIDTEVSNDTTNTVYWGVVYKDAREEALEDREEGDEEADVWPITVLDAFNEVLLQYFTQEQLDQGIEIEYSW